VKCAPAAGKDAKKRAAVRYQTTYQGKVKHAARQSRYRERLKEKVTHKGSKDCQVSDLLVDKQKKVSPVTVRPGSAVTTSIYVTHVAICAQRSSEGTSCLVRPDAILHGNQHFPSD
jgi:hypothetical protein